MKQVIIAISKTFLICLQCLLLISLFSAAFILQQHQQEEEEQQVEEQINKIINDGINGSSCGVSLTTQQGEIVTVDCISSGNKVIWYIYPTL
jgi:hypothetical protein